MKSLIVLLSLNFNYNIILGQTDTLLIFNRVLFDGYRVSGQVYYIDDILATDTVRTNIRNLVVEEFTYSAINRFQWEHRVKGNILTQKTKDRINAIMVDGRKLFFWDIYVSDGTGTRHRLKNQTIMLKNRPRKYFQ